MCPSRILKRLNWARIFLQVLPEGRFQQQSWNSSGVIYLKPSSTIFANITESLPRRKILKSTQVASQMYSPTMIIFVAAQRTKRYHFHAANNFKLDAQNICGLNFLKIMVMQAFLMQLRHGLLKFSLLAYLLRPVRFIIFLHL